ncbi:hypothetical protein Dsin_024139 [Dipteronia sinensis]|uniref:Uncharacterized protein n=1 Tax=Dipteronia sinensis TaxID=43782 RepID=A0AAE0E1R1_9ROSI|nr:hypothetical protein Dsin_024139 [Dipteronia sinensis]
MGDNLFEGLPPPSSSSSFSQQKNHEEEEHKPASINKKREASQFQFQLQFLSLKAPSRSLKPTQNQKPLCLKKA